MIPFWLRCGERLGRLFRLVRFLHRPALLVIKPGSLGDAFLFTGALRALRREYPRHRIVMACSRRASPVLERCPDVDVLLVLDDASGGNDHVTARWQRILFAARVLGRRYELAVFPVFDGASEWGTLLFGMVSASRKIALEDPALRDAHEMDKTLAVLRAAGCKVASRQDIWPEAGISAQEKEWAVSACGARSEAGGQTADDGGQRTEGRGRKAEDRGQRSEASQEPITKNDEHHPELESAVIRHPSSVFTLALCPGARFKQKQWGAEKFAELLVELGKREEARGKRLRVLILGGLEDRTIAESIVRKVESRKSKVENESLAESQRSPRNCNEEPRLVRRSLGEGGTKNEELIIEDYTGRCSLHQSFALIEQSDLCVGNDTLGLHVAIAVGTPSVVLMWGGDGDQWVPWGNAGKHRMVRADMDCRGCQGACVHERYECMERISVEMVMGAVVLGA